MIWDEMKCRVRSASVKCEECSVKCEESGCLALHCAGVVRRSCSWTTTLQQLRTKQARIRTHGPGWRTAHASSIDEKGFRVYQYIPKTTSAPPRAGTTGKGLNTVSIPRFAGVRQFRTSKQLQKCILHPVLPSWKIHHFQEANHPKIRHFDGFQVDCCIIMID